ncbi:hypothetical protein [Streptomyces sanglieri]
MPISLYVIAAALITVLAVGCAKETRHRDLTDIESAAAPDASGALPRCP